MSKLSKKKFWVKTNMMCGDKPSLLDAGEDPESFQQKKKYVQTINKSMKSASKRTGFSNFRFLEPPASTN